MKLLDIFTDESKWTRKALARQDSGSPVWPNSDLATSFCINGGCVKCEEVSPGATTQN